MKAKEPAFAVVDRRCTTSLSDDNSGAISSEEQMHRWRREKVSEHVKRIRTLKQFKETLAACAPALRKGVYELIASQLSFKVPPFWALKFSTRG